MLSRLGRPYGGRGRSFSFTGGPAEIAWTPDNLGSALTVWWDANQGVTLAGSSVSAWTDRKGGLVASQATGVNQPVFSATARNGKPGLTFNGSQFLTTAASPAGMPSGFGPFGLYMAANSTAGAVETWPFGFGGGAVPTGGGFETQNGTGNVAFGISGSNELTSVSWNTDRFVSMQRDETTEVLTIDGVEHPIDDGLTFFHDFNGASPAGIGYWPAYGSRHTGSIQHIMVLNRKLTLSERQKMDGWESWVDGKAGVNLPIGHPYKSRAPYVSDL